jgi:NADPH:quinone reductase-like Zn-dependent oxidoreductase
MKAAVFYECGEPEKIQIADVPQPNPARNQALIQVKACG